MSELIRYRWLCYYKSSENTREGVEVIAARTKEEAESLYRRFFNVSGPVVVVPRIEVVRPHV